MISRIEGDYAYLRNLDGSEVYGSISLSKLTLFYVGSRVQALNFADLYVGTQVVGRLEAGMQYIVTKVQGEYAGLQNLDGSEVYGWVRLVDLTRIFF